MTIMSCEFESHSLHFSDTGCGYKEAQVAELVDAHVSGACAARREGSSPFLGTKLLIVSLIQRTFSLK